MKHRYADSRRRFQRFPLHAEVKFRCTLPDGSWKNADGITRDVSTHSVYVKSPSCPLQNSWVDVELALLSPAGPARRIQLHGQVVRTQVAGLGEESGFVVYGTKPFANAEPIGERAAASAIPERVL